MRQGIRDFLLVLFVLVGGLVVGSNLVQADDPQPAPAKAEAPPVAAETQPAKGTPAEAQPSEAQPSATPPKEPSPTETPAADPAPAAKPAATEPAATDDPATKPADVDQETTPATKDDAPQDDAAKDDAATGEQPPGTEDAGHKTEGAATGADSGGDHAAAGAGGHADEGHGDEGHGDGGHDLTDLSHVNATSSLEDPSQFKSDLALWTFVVFLCLLALLSKFAWGPIMEGLERREMSIATAIDEAEQAAAKGAQQLKQYEAKLAAVGDETREILAQARKDAEAARDRIVAEAQEAAQRERDRAIADITTAKNSALQEVTERSVDLAVSMAGRMIRRQLTPDDRASLIREALDELPSQN